MELSDLESSDIMNTKKQLRILKSLVEKATDGSVTQELQKFFDSWDEVWDAGLTQQDEHYEEAGLDADLVKDIYNEFESLSDKVQELRDSL